MHRLPYTKIKKGRFIMKLEDIVKSGITTEQLLKNVRARLEPMNKKADYIRANLPKVVEETIKKAEEAYRGMVKLPGTGGIPEFVGNPPCWLERRHNDNEFLWQLNRMTHWQPLLEAYSLTKEEKYGRKVIEEMLDWIKVVEIKDEVIDYPLKYFTECNPLRALELGIRTYKTWPLVLEHLGNTELFNEELLEKYIITTYKQAKLLRKISPQLWPKADHNHYLMECLGLLTTALYFPELKEAQGWKEFAIKELERCNKAQLTEDGGQIEGCPSYHNGCMFWFGLTIVLANRFDFQFSEEYLERFRKSLDYSMYSFRPTGKSVPVGDSHANDISVMAAVYGYLAFDDIRWFNFLNRLITRERIQEAANEHIWRVLNVPKFHSDLNKVSKDTGDYELKTVFWNRTLKQAMIRSDWSKEALSFLFTCRTPIQNLHAHIDAMSFDFTALGKNIICDPGIYCYRDDDDRRAFKTAAYHSTVTIDNKDHFEYISSFDFGPQKYGEISLVEEKDFYSYTSAYHENYEPVIHRRHLALVDKSFLVVVDKLENLDNNSVQMYYHLDYTKIKTKDGLTIGEDDIANVAIFSDRKMKTSLLPGRLSDVNDIYRDATRLLLEDDKVAEKERIYVTLIIPYKGEDAPKVNEIKTINNSEGIEIKFNYVNSYKIYLHNNRFSMTKGD